MFVEADSATNLELREHVNASNKRMHVGWARDHNSLTPVQLDMYGANEGATDKYVRILTITKGSSISVRYYNVGRTVVIGVLHGGDRSGSPINIAQKFSV